MNEELDKKYASVQQKQASLENFNESTFVFDISNTQNNIKPEITH